MIGIDRIYRQNLDKVKVELKKDATDIVKKNFVLDI